MNNQILFEQLNLGWNAEPNAPELDVWVNDNDVIIKFFLDSFLFLMIFPKVIRRE